MAEIVLGIGTSHTPLLSLQPELGLIYAEGDYMSPELAFPPNGWVMPYHDGVEYVSPEVRAKFKGAEPFAEQAAEPRRDSLDQFDLLLLTVAKGSRIHQDGIHFQGFRYLDNTLAAYVGEDVIIRYDPRDMAELRVYFGDGFLCRAINPELAGETIGLKDIIRAGEPAPPRIAHYPGRARSHGRHCSVYVVVKNYAQNVTFRFKNRKSPLSTFPPFPRL